MRFQNLLVESPLQIGKAAIATKRASKCLPQLGHAGRLHGEKIGRRAERCALAVPEARILGRERTLHVLQALLESVQSLPDLRCLGKQSAKDLGTDVKRCFLDQELTILAEFLLSGRDFARECSEKA